MARRDDGAELRQFGRTFAVLFVGIFGLLFPWLMNSTFPLWPWGVGLVLAVVSQIRPLLLRGFYAFWLRLGNVLGWINTRVILFLIFYSLILPIGLIRRLLGYNSVIRSYREDLDSYKEYRSKIVKNAMEKPY